MRFIWPTSLNRTPNSIQIHSTLFKIIGTSFAFLHPCNLELRSRPLRLVPKSWNCWVQYHFSSYQVWTKSIHKHLNVCGHGQGLGSRYYITCSQKYQDIQLDCFISTSDFTLISWKVSNPLPPPKPPTPQKTPTTSNRFHFSRHGQG